MDGFLLVDDVDVNFLWDTIQKHQLVFHPSISPDGTIDYKKFSASKSKKPFILFVDRNILSSLLSFCEKGSLKNKGESQLIGVIMAWAELNDIAVSIGLAVREYATQLHSQEAGLVELQKFLEIFDTYPGQLWLEVAEGRRTKIPPIVYSQKPAPNITVDYADGGEHYEMAVASLLYIVRLYRNGGLNALEKVQQFFQWMYDRLPLSEYMLVYATMLFTEQNYIKAPKHAKSDNIDRIIAGCKNQAWDISYLTNWSTLYSATDNYKEEFLFATNDVLLKRIFINKNAPNGLFGVLYEAFPEKEYEYLSQYIEEKMRNRQKPNFGDDMHTYLQQLIAQEERALIDVMK